MVEVRAKFIKLGYSLLGVYKQQQEEVDRYIQESTGTEPQQLDPQSWVHIDVFNYILEKYKSASPTKERAHVTLGQRVYPTIRSTVGLPEHVLSDPLAFLKFEAEGYLAEHRGEGVAPRDFIKAEEGEVIVRALMPGYKESERLMEGVYLGILDLCRVKDKKVESLGDSTYRITWTR